MTQRSITRLVRLTLLLATFSTATGAAQTAHATARGKAILPRFHGAYTSSTNNSTFFLFISNITDATTTVTLQFYESSGSLLLDGDGSASTGVLRATNVTSWAESPSGASVSFDLAAKKTAWIEILPTSGSKIGFGLIEWAQSSSVHQALVAHGTVSSIYIAGSNYAWASEDSIEVNGGLPF